ncbi:MAG: hypothetical protein L0387_37335 [Acidobacteria bacterium]|nr:hypothetical protein [Acidobacteriota bacterium]MCI0723673.1 hypothetical protein [Acidobacteriota bacterium]
MLALRRHILPTGEILVNIKSKRALGNDATNTSKRQVTSTMNSVENDFSVGVQLGFNWVNGEFFDEAS